MRGYFIRVELPWYCFGFEIGPSGIVTQADLLAAWMVGGPGGALVDYWRGRRGAVVTWEAVG